MPPNDDSPHASPPVQPVPPVEGTQPLRRPPSRSARWIGAVIAVLAMAGVGWLAWHLTHKPAATQGAAGPGGAPGPGGPGGGRRAPATTVGMAPAEALDIPIVLEALGTVTPAATVTVRPQVSGVLKQVMFREGQLVKAGQVLAEIDARPFELALQQALGQRQRDEAQLENARLTLQRYQMLLSQDSIARQDVDTQAALVKQLEATVVIDRANEGVARLNVGYTRVVAPIAGRLGLRVVDIGNVVSSGDAAGVAVITQVAPIDVEFALPQDRVPELQERIAANAVLSATALDRTRSNVLAEGRFLALDNVVDTQTGTVRAKARFANDKGALFPSQFVNLRLNVRTITRAVVVPVSALRHASDGDFVWVLNPADRSVQMRKVTRGQATTDKVQITQGLQLGESVITEGGDRLKEGARVTLPGDRPASGAGIGASGARRGQRGERGASAGADGSAAPPPFASGASSGEHRRRRDAASTAGN